MPSTPSDPRPGPTPDRPDAFGPVQGSSDAGQLRDKKPVLIPETALPELSAGSEGGLSAGVQDGAQDGAAQAHPEASSCPDSAQAIERGHVVAAWLQSLERQHAPFGLEGRVVAAMNPGYRQERAAAALTGLVAREVPASLAALVAARVLRNDPQTREIAPEALDGLVNRRVVEPEATLVEGMAKRLDAVQAPDELSDRVELELSADSETSSSPQAVNQPEADGTEISSAPVLKNRRLGAGAMATGLALAAACAWLLTINVGSNLTSDPASGERSAEVAALSGGPDVSGDYSAGDLANAEGNLPTAGITKSGITFSIVHVTQETMTATDRALLGALGLPVTEEG